MKQSQFCGHVSFCCAAAPIAAVRRTQWGLARRQWSPPLVDDGITYINSSAVHIQAAWILPWLSSTKRTINALKGPATILKQVFAILYWENDMML
jgi:hypothetical protein